LLEQLKYLVELQFLVDKKAGLVRAREETPRRIEELERQFAEFEGEYHQKKMEYENALKMRRSLEQDVKDLENKLARSKSRTHEVKTNREYQALLKEVEDLREDIRIKEDQTLEYMEVIERLDKEVKSAGKDLEARRKQLEEDKEKVRQESDLVDTRLGALEVLQEEVRRKMDPVIVKRYDFLMVNRAGSAVAAVQDGTCQLCHLSLPPQKYVELQRDDAIMNCPSCLRFIYWQGNDAYQVFADDLGES
jgi:predicted  nucleic acid-binding Zn-ribbon protein